MNLRFNFVISQLSIALIDGCSAEYIRTLLFVQSTSNVVDWEALLLQNHYKVLNSQRFFGYAVIKYVSQRFVVASDLKVTNRCDTPSACSCCIVAQSRFINQSFVVQKIVYTASCWPFLFSAKIVDDKTFCINFVSAMLLWFHMEIQRINEFSPANRRKMFLFVTAMTNLIVSSTLFTVLYNCFH